MSALGPLLPVWELDRPRHMRDELGIVWDAAGQPFGLVIDRRFYRVRPSPRLSMPEGGRMQRVFRRHSGPSDEGDPPDTA